MGGAVVPPRERLFYEYGMVPSNNRGRNGCEKNFRGRQATLVFFDAAFVFASVFLFFGAHQSEPDGTGKRWRTAAF